MIMAIQKDLYLEWRKRCLFLFLFFFFFLMETNDLAWLGLYSDFFSFTLFIYYLVLSAQPYFKRTKIAKTTQKRGGSIK